ncbi:MAG: CoA-binding protein, partial [Rubritepida sp.]|nr:CoA-binding protein [Rubritepida sp.]
MSRLAPLLAPRSVAVIGASADPARIGGTPLRCLAEWGFAGAVYPVNPKYERIRDWPCFPDVAALPEAPDLAILAVGAPEVLPQLRALHARGVPAAMVYASGFEEEASAEGAARGTALAAFARETGMAICGPNCMGGANYATRAYTAFVPSFMVDDPPGDTAVIAQSGNICAVLWR